MPGAHLLLCAERLREARERIAELEHQRDDLLAALTDLLNHLPECEIELAREVWGNTNTRLVLEKRAAAYDAIAKAKGAE